MNQQTVLDNILKQKLSIERYEKIQLIVMDNYSIKLLEEHIFIDKDGNKFLMGIPIKEIFYKGKSLTGVVF